MNAFMSVLYGVHRTVITMEKIVLFVILATMIFMSFGQVVARNLFNQGYMWVDIFLRHGVIWVTFIGASLASEYRQHIKIDVLSYLLSSPFKQKAFDMAVSLFQIVFCGLLAVSSLEYVSMLKEYPTYDLKWFPVWGLRLVVPFSFVMMMMSGIFHIFHTVTNRELPMILFEREIIELSEIGHESDGHKINP